MFFKEAVIEMHTTTYFYFSIGACSEWGGLGDLCPRRLSKPD